MKKYEYRVIELKIATTFSQEKLNKRLEEELNKYGAYGWELCSFERGVAYFKRELED